MLSFTDAHVHFHDLRSPDLRYDWLAPEASEPDLGDHGAIKSLRYWADDFIGETRFHNVERVIHVQAALGSDDPVQETRWLQRFVERLGLPHGIVAGADLAADDISDVLARHTSYANVCGIRDLRYDDYLTNRRWHRGYGLLEQLGLVFCDDPALEEFGLARRLADEHPGVTLCIDHAGYPRERTPEYFERWRKGLRDLAGAENTVIKISGLGQCDHRWTVESMRPWALACIEAFGPERSFFGSNWPVDRLFSSYGDLISAYASIIREFSADEQRALFSDNAKRIFRLDD
jgi:predicted TIM-barrel fold metal-dependent hydrolase